MFSLYSHGILGVVFTGRKGVARKSRAQQASKGCHNAFSRSDSFSAIDLVGQLFLPSRLRGLFASGRRDVEPAILPTRPLSVVISEINSFAVTWVQSVIGIGATRECVLFLAGTFLGLHWCRHSALCFASSLLKRTDTFRAIHRTTRSAIELCAFDLVFACGNCCLYSCAVGPTSASPSVSSSSLL